MKNLPCKPNKTLAATLLLLGVAAWEGRAIVGGVVTQTQCRGPARASMQNATGSSSLNKVGIHVCTTVCPPKYYTVVESGYVLKTAHEEFTAESGSPCVSYTKDVTYEENSGRQEMNKFNTKATPPQTGYVQREECGGSDPEITPPMPVATGTASVTGAPNPFYQGCGYPGPVTPGGSTSKDSAGDWIDSSMASIISAYFDNRMWDSCEDISPECDFDSTTRCTQTISWNSSMFGTFSAQVTATEGGTRYSGEFTTTELKSTVDGRAASRVPGTFSNGDATRARTLGGDEVCATAKDARYRIKITGYEPNKRYDIKYVVTTRHRDGSSERVERTVQRRAPASGDWFYPSPTGGLLPKPPWPPGACTQGGTESITYSDADVVAID